MPRDPLPEMYRRLGRQLKALRNDRGMTQSQVAEQADVALSSLVKFEAGARGPRLETLDALAKVLQVSVAAFFPEPRGLSAPRGARAGRSVYQGGRTLELVELEVNELAELARELDRKQLRSVTEMVRQMRPRR